MVESTKPADLPKDLWEINVKDIDGKEGKLNDYKGSNKAFLFGNVASACGYTDTNYKALVALREKYGPKGLEIFGFPCNQFGAQEQEGCPWIKKFTKDSYKVDFPMFDKVEVKGANMHPVYQYLNYNSELYDEVNKKLTPIPWNFSYFLVDADGKVVKFIKPADELDDAENAIKKLLNA
mmetsp:Transcript_65271/g.75902  ORF Transcript_65271/g.75902 Transcript_65271/m.75902 type:complete len:179 (-) Transcript_65271:113-649(-)